MSLRTFARSRRFAGTAAALSVTALAATAVVVGGPSANAAPGCRVNYSVTNQWSDGFGATVTVTNLGDAITGGWTLEWDFAAGQRVGQGWNGTFAQSGAKVTVTNPTWSPGLGSNASVSPGFNGTWSGSNPVPTQFKLNGTVCTGSVGPTSTTTTTTTTTTGGNTTTTTSGNNQPGTRVDNPYVGAGVYVNPQWSARAAAEPGGSRIANQPTGVWMDRISAIDGNGSPTTGSMGLVDHLDEAVKQARTAPGGNLVFQVVIYNLPGRDCAALASNGELGPNDLPRYKTEYIDKIAGILARPAYASLRIVAVIEIDSLPNLVTNVSPRPTQTPNCDTMKANQNYQNGVAYAVSKLGDIGNVYNYLDSGHHGWIGWGDPIPEYDNFHASAKMMASILGREGATKADVHGFITNTANYSALEEPFWTVDDVVGGQAVKEKSKWVDWNDFNGELGFATAFRQELVANGFDAGVGMLIDTSRNGWGGSGRPTAKSSSTDPSVYVDQSRIDKRIQKGNWCNQSGAGLGERPKAAPKPNIDAYVWIKPPGESDGSSTQIPNNEGKGFDRMCDPTYGGNPRNGNNPSGALANAPISGHWFSAQFQELMRNAYPTL
ncbi:glycoside hydrolase family 6 protein [Actinosynnema pretiosum subsp. pretiosum]|uniref:Glucanase n=2 Tax=Actinosynnema TaxID=40566 RepID=C6WI93_ACTMD|nr:glycoside hydrolase family 6 [Actinosynnema mirum DSM 43827]AXX29587.1 Chitinase [Actinosynnema pretiosum subsp. pretiosum]QUF06179.1 glycoside hydrolase family 6 protein [Actinosynnema pretiosum subsp. pretiosum]